MKLPFELITDKIESAYDRAAIATNDDVRQYYLSYADKYLEQSGWTKEEYQKELLKRVDNSWEAASN